MVLKKGMLGKFVPNKQANIYKGNDKNKDRRNPLNIFQKGVDGQKAKKQDGSLKGKTKGKQENYNKIGRREGF